MIINYKSTAYDGIVLLRTPGWGKIYNFLKNKTSFLLSRLFRYPVVWGGPYSLQFETSALCNLRCPECVTGTGVTVREKKLADPGIIAGKFSLHQRHAFYCNLYFQGEPFLHPDIFRMIRQAREKGYYTAIATNGHFLDDRFCSNIVDSGLNRIIVSLDGTTAETYSSYRHGGQFEKVTKGISRLAGLKKSLKKHHPLLVVQCLVNKNNEHQVEEMKLLAKQMGADVLEFKSMQIISEQGGQSFLPRQRKYNRYQASSGGDEAPGKSCFRLWSHMVYTSDGQVVACCFDKVPQYAVPSRQRDELDGWKSAFMMQLRSAVIRGEDLPSICNNCIY